jgi:3-hydroxybutyryl-CoA dehydrogenase
MINEAIFTLYEGAASRESIDGIMKLGMNHPMGPLTLADFIGLDVCLAIMNVLYEGLETEISALSTAQKYVDAVGWAQEWTGLLRVLNQCQLQFHIIVRSVLRLIH